MKVTETTIPTNRTFAIELDELEAVTLFCIVAKIGAHSLQEMGFDLKTMEQHEMRERTTSRLYEGLRHLAESYGYGHNHYDTDAIDIMHRLWKRGDS